MDSGSAFGLPPTTRDRSSGAQDGDTWFNASSSSVYLFPITRNNVSAFVHEIGHALGLAHPSAYNGADVTYDTNAEFREDSLMYSVMSYFSPTNTGGSYIAKGMATRFVTPQIMDVVAIQALYGANMTTRTGDTVYGFNSNADRAWLKATAQDQVVFTIWDAGGQDTLDFSGYSTNAEIDLRAGAFSSVGLLKKNIAIALGVTIENAVGGAGDDVLRGNAVSNRLEGRGGDDVLTGDDGHDTAVYSGRAADFQLTALAGGGWRVQDLRGGRPEGTDTLSGIEAVSFADATADLVKALSSPALVLAYGAVLTTTARGSDLVALTDLAGRVEAGGLTQAAAISEIIRAAGATTSVATLAYEFFTGKIPGGGGIDYLVSPTGPNANNLNSAYYQSFNLENRYINFAVNLGKVGEGNAKFTAEYGSLSLFDATKKAYAAIFGGTPTDAKVTALLSGGRDAYFATYGGDGLNGIGTKAAMVGWLLAEAQKADLGVMVRSNDAWLLDLSDGAAPFAIDILDPAKGYWKADFVFGG